MREYDILPGRNLSVEVRRQRPLIHCITNYVTAGDVANMILASGASPVMADGIQEAEDITRLSRALVLNIGTLREDSVESMLAAGRVAADLGHPVIFDPVGAGASAFRTEMALRVVREVPCTVIRGNASEIKILAQKLAEGAGSHGEDARNHGEDARSHGEDARSRGEDARNHEEDARSHGESIGIPAGYPVRPRGVDADEREKVTGDNKESTILMLRSLSRETGAMIVMTGEKDLIVDKNQSCLIQNGHAMMTQITGTGCMMDGILAAFLAVSSAEERFSAAVYAVSAHGICGELAYERVTESKGGTGSFRMHFIDSMSRLEDEEVRKGVRYEV